MHARFLPLLLLAGCGTPPHSTATYDAAQADFADASGVVRTLEVGADTPLFVVYPDEEPTTRFCLATEALPTDLRRDGARVVFTGNREEIPANYRMACAPFELLAIEGEQ